jgi:hypothetical protein
MHPFLHWLERAVDKSIPYFIVALGLVLIVDLTHLVDLHAYEPGPTVFDVIVTIVFVTDLVFKWFRTRKVLAFLRHYWIDIIAVFPFFLIFRVVAYVGEFFRAGEEAQRILHEAVLLRETRLLREAQFAQRAESIVKEARAGSRLLRAIPRLFRLIKARCYVTHEHLVRASRHLAGHGRARRRTA